MKRIAVLASGRGSNLEALLQAQEAGELGGEILLVVSDNPGAQALSRAASRGIPTCSLRPSQYTSREDFEQALVEVLREFQIELVVLAGYMRLVSSVLLTAFPNRVINIHPSLLPAFPGLKAQEQAFDYGVKYTGCTVHFVDEGMDTGPIIGQAVVPVLATDTVATLTERILAEEHRLYPKVIRQLAQGQIQLKGRKVEISPKENP